LCATVELLLHKGADAAHTDTDGRTALHLAASSGCPRVCGILLREPALNSMLKARTTCGFTALHLAAKFGHATVAVCLLEARAEAAALSSQHRTPLHLAAMEGHAAVVECLLAADSCVQSLTDVEGMRALDYAVERGWSAPARSLTEEAKRHDVRRSQWRSLFEPPSRSLLNTSAVEACLELGPPRLLSSGRSKSLRLLCRLVDKWRLVKHWCVHTFRHGEDKSPVEVWLQPSQVRSLADQPIRDVELLLPRHLSDGSVLWRPGAEHCFSVVCELDSGLASAVGVEVQEICSEWTAPLRL